MFSSVLTVSIISFTKTVSPDCSATALTAALSSSTLPLSVLIMRFASVFSAIALTVFSVMPTSEEAAALLPAASITISADLLANALSTILFAVVLSTAAVDLSPETEGVMSAVVFLSAALFVTLWTVTKITGISTYLLHYIYRVFLHYSLYLQTYKKGEYMELKFLFPHIACKVQ